MMPATEVFKMRKIGHFSVFSFLILSLAILFFSVPSANADGILGPDLTTRQELGAQGAMAPAWAAA